MAASGLFTNDGKALPLRTVTAEGDVKGYLSGLAITLVYENNESNPVEVKFKMPMENSQIVVGLSAVIDGRKVRGDLKEKEEAKMLYDDAIASGQTAALGESVTGDIFSITLGSLSNGSKAEIELQLVSQLPIDALGNIRFSLPTILKSRYTPLGYEGTSPTAILDGATVGSVDGIEHLLLRIHNCDMIKSIVSATHSIDVKEILDSDYKTITLSDIHSDVVIDVTFNSPHVPFTLTELGIPSSSGDNSSFMSQHVLMLNYFPNIPSHHKTLSEFIFLVDRSGSMSGSFIKSASETLVLFMKSLPEGCYFNIYGFGSSYTHLFDSSVPYNEGNLEKAMEHLRNLQADLGGTNILPPLRKIFQEPLIKDLPRQIFVLTDGSVSNTHECIREVKLNEKIARCFTFGIGSGASSELVEGMARAGGGTAEFIKEGERMQPKVVRSLKHAMQPALTDVTLTFDIPDVVQVPRTIPAVFDGNKLVLFAIIKADSGFVQSENHAALKYLIGSEVMSHDLKFKFDASHQSSGGYFSSIIHRFAAEALLKEMEKDGNVSKDEKVKLSIESNVLCKDTTFIVIDEESSNPIEAPMTVYDCAIDVDSCIANVRSIMSANINMALTRGEALDSLQCQSELLSTNALEFKSASRSKKGGLPGLGFLSNIGSSISSFFTRSSQPERVNNYTATETTTRSNYTPDTSLDQYLEGAGSRLVITPTQDESFSSIVAVQKANGSWIIDESLSSFLSKTLKEIGDALPAGCSSNEVWATVLVVTALRERFLSQEDEWELVAGKANDWLKRQHSDDELSRFCDAAKLFLSN
jgi:hypothetical protein